ncbi:MAG: response regulator transcription factor [Anaerolineae bacterium]|nr:response regulator transcription factor [Anaerolineae bacterium]
MLTKILIVDDHGVLRAGLRALLSAEPDLEVLGEADSGDEALSMAQLLKPDVVLLDLSMPGSSGIHVARQLKQQHPQIRTLILTVHEDDTLVREAIRVGASGYIVKKAVETELIDAIKAVSRNELYVHPAMTRALIGGVAPETEGVERAVDILTPRETEVLRFIAQGYTNKQIAELLSLSVRTVESHRSNLMGKLGMSTRVELVRYAKENKIIKD